jgi:anti-anti-sigma factor
MTNPYFDIREEVYDGRLRLRLIGELDLLTAASLADRLQRLQTQKRHVLLDLSRLDFIDSTGIRVLVRALQQSRDDRGWEFQIEPHLTVAVRRVLSLVNLDRFLLTDGATAQTESQALT